MQNVPFLLEEAGLDLNLKALFLPDSDEYDLYDLDIKNAEMRILCAYSLDDGLIEVFLNNRDIHCLTAEGISQYSYDEVMANKDNKGTEPHTFRKVAKTVNFGIVYCMGAETLAHDLWVKLRIKKSPEETAEYIRLYFVKYPGVKKYMETTQRFAASFKYTFTFTGRRRRFPIATYSSREANRMGRQAVNGRIQTTSADLMGMNIVDLEEAIRPLGGRLLLTVHDSVAFQLPKGTPGVQGILDQVIINNVRERCSWMPVPWTYDVGYGPSYGEANLPI